MAVVHRRTPRITLDGQLVGYWEREAARFEALAQAAGLVWQRRRYARKAEEARLRGARSREREAERGRDGPHDSLG